MSKFGRKTSVLASLLLVLVVAVCANANTVYFEENFDDNDLGDSFGAGGGGTRIAAVDSGRLHIGAAVSSTVRLSSSPSVKPLAWNGTPSDTNWVFELDFEIPPTYEATLAAAGLTDATVNDFALVRLTGGSGGIIVWVDSINLDGSAKVWLSEYYSSSQSGYVDVSRGAVHNLKIVSTGGATPDIEFYIDGGAPKFTGTGNSTAMPNSIEIGSLSLSYSRNGELFLDNIVFSDIPEPATLALLSVGGCLMVLRRRHKVR